MTALVKSLAVAALIATLYAGVLAEMAVDWWTEPASSHGLLIPPLALLLAWFLRRRTLAEPAVPHWIGLVVSGFACALLLLGRLAAEYFLQRISFVVLLVGLTLTFWGVRRLRTLAFPFLLLTTMVPFPALISNAVALPLQLLASNLATDIARLFGVAVFQDGNLIHLAGTTLGVEEACSGLSAISALTVASLLAGFLVDCRTWVRVLLVALACPIAVGVNIVRVAGSAILADHSAALAQGFYHSFSGWLVFVLGATALFGAAQLLRRIPSGRSHA